MSFLLRSCFATVFVGSIAFASHAQEMPAAPPASTEVVSTTPSPLLKPTQMQGEKYKDYLSKRYADDKQAQAVIHLFKRKHTGGIVWLATGAGAIGLISSQTGTKTTDTGTYTFTVSPIGYGVLVGLFGGVGIGKLTRFSDDKLYSALASHDQSQPFPSYVVNKIRKKDRK